MVHLREEIKWNRFKNRKTKLKVVILVNWILIFKYERGVTTTDTTEIQKTIVSDWLLDHKLDNLGSSWPTARQSLLRMHVENSKPEQTKGSAQSMQPHWWILASISRANASPRLTLLQNTGERQNFQTPSTRADKNTTQTENARPICVRERYTKSLNRILTLPN